MLDASEREVQRLVTAQMEVGWTQTPPLCVSGVSGCAVTTPGGCTADPTLSHQPWLQVVTQDPLPHVCLPHTPLHPQRTQAEFPTHHPQG